MGLFRDILAVMFGRNPAAMTRFQIEQMLARRAAGTPEKLDWKTSVVDLMKLVGMDSSLSARVELARKLGYGGNTNLTAPMNTWLHRKIMDNLAANNGVPNF